MLFIPFKRFIRERQLLKEGDGVVLAVSGGIDSMVMLDLFCRLAKPWKLRLSVAHVNYGLRGRESDRDERFVQAACEDCDLCFELLRNKIPGGVNMQNEARRVRYHFLGEVAARRGAAFIATAHQRDDQAETILLHLIRGSGLRGLAGMPEKSSRGQLSLIRPLLFATRDEIERYAKLRGVFSCKDRTNTETAYTRNRVRHILMPALMKFNPRIVDSLADMGERLQEDDRALDLVTLELFGEIAAVVEDGRVILRRLGFLELPAGIRTRLLKIAYEKASGSAADLNADQQKKMDVIASREKPRGSYRLRSPWIFVREKNFLTISRSPTSCDRRGGRRL